MYKVRAQLDLHVIKSTNQNLDFIVSSKQYLTPFWITNNALGLFKEALIAAMMYFEEVS